MEEEAYPQLGILKLLFCSARWHIGQWFRQPDGVRLTEQSHPSDWWPPSSHTRCFQGLKERASERFMFKSLPYMTNTVKVPLSKPLNLQECRGEKLRGWQKTEIILSQSLLVNVSSKRTTNPSWKALKQYNHWLCLTEELVKRNISTYRSERSDKMA